MIVTTKGRKALLFGGVAASSLLLAACGGGGGDEPSVTYTGVTTAAVIDETTAPVLADQAISSVASDPTGGTTSFVGVQATASGPAPIDQLKGFVDTVKRLSADITPGADSLAGVKVTQSFEMDGCTGSMTMSGTVDDTYWDASGAPIFYSFSISFSNYSDEVYDFPTDTYYCDPDSEILNGSISATVTYDGPVDSTPQMDGMTITINSLSMTTAMGQSQAFSGSVAESINTATGESTVTMTVNFRNVDGQVYRMEDYTVLSDSLDNVISVSGTLYDPVYGYIDLSTPTVFSYAGGCYDAYYYPIPSSGVLRIDGANGGYITIDANTSNCSTYTLIWSDGTTTLSSTKYW